MLNDSDVARFKRDGFLLIKGLFSADEVQRLRDQGQHIEGPVDLASVPGLENFWTDGRLVAAAKRLLGEPITYFGEASYRRYLFPSEKPLTGKLHHDAKGTRDHLFLRQNLPTPEPYPIIRFGMYLQDHARFSGGLKLVPGSHQMDTSTFNEAALAHLDVPSEPGDAVVFCNKILHSPFALRRKDAPNAALSVPDELALFARDPDAFLPNAPDRRTVFVDYAGPGDLADIYIKSRAVNPTNTRDGFLDLALRGTLIDDAARLGVRLRLDSAIVEAVQKIIATADGPVLNKTGRQFLKMLPMLCRQSQPWSDRFDFVPAPPRSDSEAEALPLLNAVSLKVAQLRSVVKWRADLLK